jgi:hypothetical protein
MIYHSKFVFRAAGVSVESSRAFLFSPFFDQIRNFSRRKETNPMIFLLGSNRNCLKRVIDRGSLNFYLDPSCFIINYIPMFSAL